jgi:N-acetylglucosaminyldiphosphoundecaprenol N-acetyl-beta-D-mannosaminyltransferase
MSSQAQVQPVAKNLFTSDRWERIPIGHALVDGCSFSDAIEELAAHARRGGAPAQVITPNAQHIVLLDRDERLQEVYRDADLVVPDGYSLVLAAKLLGRRFPQRVAGVDLFQELCGKAAQDGLRVFLLGGRPGAADLAVSVMQTRFPGLQAGTYCPPFGFEKSAVETAQIAQRIAEFRPHLLFVAFGSPKQEYWIYDHGRRLGAAVCVGVGGSFEMVSGLVPRAPRWMQNMGCEWLYRLYREPRRMWRRYLIGNVEFAWIVLRQIREGRGRQAPPKVRTISVADRY